MRAQPPWLLLAELSLVFQTLRKTRQLHATIITAHLSIDPFFATRILRYYDVNGDLRSAGRVFDQCPHRSVFLWNSVIRAYARAHDFGRAFALFASMLCSETRPDEFTFACVLRTCAENSDLRRARWVHGIMTVCGLSESAVSATALVAAHAKLGDVGDARVVFDGMPEPDLVSWNTMLLGYGGAGDWVGGFELFGKMRDNGMKPDGYTMVALILCICNLNSLESGRGIHGVCLKHGFDSGAHVGSALVSMYSRCENLTWAHQVFSEFDKPDLVMWSSLITGFAQSGECGKALKLFSKMNEINVMPDPILVSSVLAACAQLATAEPGKEIHAYAIKRWIESEVVVSSALMDMYSKCGLIGLGLQIFEMMPERNLVVYNAAISGLGSHGLGSEAVRLFEEMLQKGFQPDASTFSALLCACCHGGLVNEGKDIFEKMDTCYGVTPEMEHYVYMVKLFVTVGELDEAYNLILSMPILPASGVWGALLSGCSIYQNSRLAEIVAYKLFQIDPDKSAYKVMLSNIYAADGRWNDVRNLRGEMMVGRLRKTPGISRMVHGTL